MCKEKFNGLHVPDISTVDMSDVQYVYCNTSNKCVDDCGDCLFAACNLSEFEKYFNSHLKTDIDDK